MASARSGTEIDWELNANLIGRAPSFVDAVFLIGRVAACDAPVLVSGETGTGKELAARAIHYLSARRDGPFVAVNCAAIPDTLIESELFGHARGAFSGASAARRGLARLASGGTLFLDEVEALTCRAQGVLLRFLQDGSFRPVGDDNSMRADVRIVSASNVDLCSLASRGEFRQDLLFRLMVLEVSLPPLRERREDIPLLTEHFLSKTAESLQRPRKHMDAAAMELLCSYPWPGNVRELEHVVLRLQIYSSASSLSSKDLIACVPALAALTVRKRDTKSLVEAKRCAVEQVERDFVRKALLDAGGNISAAARMHKLDRAFVSRLAKKHRSAVLDGKS